MKKALLALTALILILTTTTSCVSTKKIRYFQGADSLYAEARAISQQYEMRIKTADQVQIKVFCSEPDLLEPFKKSVILGTSTDGGQNTNSQLSNSNAFTVSNKGEIEVPLLGKIHIADLTCEECEDLVEKMLKEKGIIQDPDVTVRLMNARVTVIGAVSSPGVKNLTSERNTITDILAQCGDIDDTGQKQKIQLFREQDGKRQLYELDMTKADIFNSPAYYVQQNDLIYVLPNKTKNIKASPMYTFMTAGSSIMAFVTTIISFILLFRNL